MSDLFNGWPEDGEPVTTMSDEEMVEWCNQTQDTIIAQRKEIERLRSKCNQRRDDLRQARDILDERYAKIERLQAALYEIAERDPLESISASIARAALENDE
jgi:hypothetical protein